MSYAYTRDELNKIASDANNNTRISIINRTFDEIMHTVRSYAKKGLFTYKYANSPHPSDINRDITVLLIKSLEGCKVWEEEGGIIVDWT